MKNAIRTTLAACAALVALQTSSFAQQLYLNEIYADQVSTDIYEFIELKGPAGTSLDNHLVLIVEGDFSTSGNHGKLKKAWDLTGYTIPASGFFVLGDSGLNASTSAPATPDFIIGTSNSIENGSQTIYLVDAGNPTNVATLVAEAAAVAQLDPDGDQITTIPTVATILDLVGMVDSGFLATTNPDRIYDGAIVMGPDVATPPSVFNPAGIFRGSDAPNGWCDKFLDFNEANNTTEPRTPGAANSVCPVAFSVTSYCTAGTTTNGCTATMGFTGAPLLSLGAGGFNVNCTGIEGSKTGLIFYSISGPAALNWGTSSSFLCVKSPNQRSGTVPTGGTANACDGQISLDFFDFITNVNPGALGVPFSAGNQAWFQCWFRDPPSPKTTMLSDALEVTFAP
ncbi:MAG: hypothetical protein HUU28_14205 [Planctomycetaceae bacterium]|nr:hypothetical protein [Planctomycetaceae bacterium]